MGNRNIETEHMLLDDGNYQFISKSQMSYFDKKLEIKPEYAGSYALRKDDNKVMGIWGPESFAQFIMAPNTRVQAPAGGNLIKDDNFFLGSERNPGNAILGYKIFRIKALDTIEGKAFTKYLGI